MARIRTEIGGCAFHLALNGSRLFAVTALLLTPAAVLAQECETYATLAVSQNRENIARDCGFAGPLWSSTKQSHLDWCRQDGTAESTAKRTAIRKDALTETCPTGKGDLAAEGWCYAIDADGAGSTIMLSIHPVVRNDGGRDWYSTVGGSYSIAASGPNPLQSLTRALPAYPQWSIAAGERKRLGPVALPFHEDNAYGFGWNLQSPDDLDPSNNEMRLHSLGSGWRFLDDGDLANMKCDLLDRPFAAVIPSTGPSDPFVRSFASPAVARFEFGVAVAAVQPDGAVMVNATTAPGGWDGWSHLSGIRGETTTAPVLVAQEAPDRLHLFVRDTSDNLFHAEKAAGAKWSGWFQVTAGNEIRGRVSIAQTTEGGRHFHIMFPSATVGNVPVVSYRRYDSGLNVVQREETYRGFVEGTLGSYLLQDPTDPDDKDRILQVLMATDGLLVLDRTAPWTFTDDLTPQALARATPGVFPSFDISDPVELGGGFHFAYTGARWSEEFGGTDRGQVLHHVYVRPDAPDAARITTVTKAITDRMVMRSALAKYRNRLVLGYNTPDGAINYARLDMTVPSWPWLGAALGPTVSLGTNRLALVAVNFRRFNPNWDVADYGNDLFAALSYADMADQVAFSNFSRTILQEESARQFKIYQSRSGASGCRQDGTAGGNPCTAPLFVGSVWNEDRPFMTELGMTLWAWPSWFSDTAWYDASQIGCARGHRSGRFEEPCSAARYPVVSMGAGAGNPFIDGGAWVFRGSEMQEDLLHELSHAVLDPVIGFVDSGSPPGSVHAVRSGISEADLRAGFQIFGEELFAGCNSNPPNPSCLAGRSRGFVNLSGQNYDRGSRQHSFIGAMQLFIHDGDTMRVYIADDDANGHDLLRRKYEWIRTNLFNGLEFKAGYEPR